MRINGWGADLEMLALARKFILKIIELPIKWESKERSTVKTGAFLQTLKELLQIRRRMQKFNVQN